VKKSRAVGVKLDEVMGCVHIEYKRVNFYGHRTCLGLSFLTSADGNLSSFARFAPPSSCEAGRRKEVEWGLAGLFLLLL
jgi:hypothetical protein